MRAPIFLIALLAATPALAQSNMGLTEYPAPKCQKPPSIDGMKQPTAPDNPNPAQASIYNSQIRAYNNAVRARNEALKPFNDRIQAYVAAGNADIKRIQDAVNSAVAAANAP